MNTVVDAYNFSTLVIEAGGSGVEGSTWLHRDSKGSPGYMIPCYKQT